VVYLDRYRIWATARYEEVNAALKDCETYSSASGAGLSNFRKEGRENLLPYAFGPRNELLAQAMAKAQTVQEWITASCQRESLRPGSFGAQIWETVDKGKVPLTVYP